RQRRDETRIAHVAARDPCGLWIRHVPEVAQDLAAPAFAALDKGPHGAVLAPARTLTVACRALRTHLHSSVPLAAPAAGYTIHGRRRGLEQPRPREMPDHRAQLLAVDARSSGQLGRLDVVAPVGGTEAEVLGHGRERAVGHRGALDEEDVQALVALSGE